MISHPCPACGSAMTYEPPDPGEPPSLAAPMGGCEATPGTWLCECGAVERDEGANEE
jgi:hypothetical protein